MLADFRIIFFIFASQQFYYDVSRFVCAGACVYVHTCSFHLAWNNYLSFLWFCVFHYFWKISESEKWTYQSCLTLCDPMDYKVHGILQARILEWVAFPSPGDLPNPGIEPRSPALQVDSLPAEPQGKPSPNYLHSFLISCSLTFSGIPLIHLLVLWRASLHFFVICFHSFVSLFSVQKRGFDWFIQLAFSVGHSCWVEISWWTILEATLDQEPFSVWSSMEVHYGVEHGGPQLIVSAGTGGKEISDRCHGCVQHPKYGKCLSSKAYKGEKVGKAESLFGRGKSRSLSCSCPVLFHGVRQLAARDNRERTLG